MSAGYRDRMMTPRTSPAPPKISEAAGCTSYPGKLFFDPLAAPEAPGEQGLGSASGGDGFAAKEPRVRPRKKVVVDERALRAASLSKVSRELERMLRERAR
ncbi:hypothetical protein [Arthrobacter sp. Alg241-R88]|uniref:hypothetical protein n=1 Tax=Arthrobacter sp. Alg241-R88 TaxID=2305984 RepID=UPI001F073A8A|nr:hypothetical protein [Arthrobacter sp. Alg241-R88]